MTEESWIAKDPRAQKAPGAHGLGLLYGMQKAEESKNFTSPEVRPMTSLK